ncbi:MAG: serine/threonine-protein kinase [Candidatus Poribacteria bacterium]|nr:serine/threonine-protein kinase [Candidatus Poribacteria bacterium]MDE0322566.1 serine/threonine-protein kinase [Candidatus Poribacteria bacterium]
MQIDQLILGKYRLLEFLNSGGFSSVFRAREEMTNRTVAIKALAKTAYPASRMKFLLTEFQAMSQIWGHPNIVSIHTVEPGEGDYVAWIVMEYVEGKSLHDLMQEGALSLTDTLNIGLDICRGLEEAHTHKIMHRDIKPQNILLTTEKQAKVADFSIARIFGETTEFAETMAGTRRYMAPEQHYGAYDYRADLYSTALILYQAVTGRFPFSGENKEIDKKKAAGEIEEIHRCPEVLRNFLQKALHRQLQERHQSASEMYEELDRIRQDEYVKQASQLINASVTSNNSRLIEALERYRKTFRLSLADAERMNQNLFFQRRQKEEGIKRGKLAAELQRHYTLATRYIENQDYPSALAEIHRASHLSTDDQGVTKTVDNLFKKLSTAGIVLPVSPTVEEIAALIQKLPENENAVLREWLEQSISVPQEEIIDVTPIQPRIRASGSYRLVIEEASPEFLLDQVHSDIQYPHEEEALRIFRQIQIYEQQGRTRQYHTLYRRLGRFYQKQANNFLRKDDLELVANCYTRARFAYTVAEKQRLARKNAKKGAVYYTRLARQFELQRSWEEAGKSYILAGYNHGYANIPSLVEECHRMATVCYFNAAESAHLNGELQTAYDFYLLILAIGEKMSVPTKMVSEAQKLMSEIPIEN